MALIKCPECKKKISDQCGKCPNCGYPIEKICDADENQITDVEKINDRNTTGKKSFDIKTLLKKWWFWVAVGVVIVAIAVTTILLLNRDTKPKFDKDGNPMFVELTNEVYTNAEDYLGYHINIKGKVFQVMGDNGSVKGIQIWIDPDTCEQNMMIYYSTDVEVKQGDYIMCSGYIDSVTEYKNAYDAKLYAPLVISSDLVKATYIDVMSPTTATLTPENLKQEKYGYSISIDKIEFAEKETRVYATVMNNGKASLNIGDTVIVQDGKQYNSTDNYEADYEGIPYEIVMGVSCSGIIVFPAITTNEFELTFDIHSDDFDEEIDKFTFKVSKDNIVVETPVETKPIETPTTAPSQQVNPTSSRKEKAVTIALNNANDTTTPNAIKTILVENGYSANEINYAVYGGHINWQKYIPGYVFSLTSETEKTTVTNCIRCQRRFYGEYQVCQYLNCGGSVNWSYYYGYSRADTIDRLLGVGYLQEDVDAAMQNYEYGEFIDEKGLDDCIKVIGTLCEHSWNPATCQELSSCPYCGETKGDYAEHDYSKHKCIRCGKEEPWSPPKISCSDWVSLKDLEEKAGYYITTPGNTLTIEDLNDERVNFVLVGFSGGAHGVVYEMDYNGTTIHYKYESGSNYWNEIVKVKYTDLVAIGVLS